MKLLIYSLALFGAFHTHATLPSVAATGPSREEVDPREDLCLSDDEKALVTAVLLARGSSPEAAREAIEGFERACLPRK